MQQKSHKPRQSIIKVKSHIMSVVKVQTVTTVHLSIVRRHQIKKWYHIWLLLEKVVANLEKVLSLKWRCPPQEGFHWWGGECSTGPATRLIVECSMGMSPGQEGIDLRLKQQTQDFWSQQKQAHIDYQAHLKSKRIENKDIKMMLFSLRGQGATF